MASRTSSTMVNSPLPMITDENEQPPRLPTSTKPVPKHLPGSPDVEGTPFPPTDAHPNWTDALLPTSVFESGIVTEHTEVSGIRRRRGPMSEEERTEQILHDLWIAGTVGMNLSLRNRYDPLSRANQRTEGPKGAKYDLETVAQKVLEASDRMRLVGGAWTLGVVKIYHNAWRTHEANAQKLLNQILNTGLRVRTNKRKKSVNDGEKRKRTVHEMLSLSLIPSEIEAALSEIPNDDPSMLLPRFMSQAAETMTSDATSIAPSVHTWAHSDIDLLLAGHSTAGPPSCTADAPSRQPTSTHHASQAHRPGGDLVTALNSLGLGLDLPSLLPCAVSQIALPAPDSDDEPILSSEECSQHPLTPSQLDARVTPKSNNDPSQPSRRINRSKGMALDPFLRESLADVRRQTNKAPWRGRLQDASRCLYRRSLMAAGCVPLKMPLVTIEPKKNTAKHSDVDLIAGQAIIQSIPDSGMGQMVYRDDFLASAGYRELDNYLCKLAIDPADRYYGAPDTRRGMDIPARAFRRSDTMSVKNTPRIDPLADLDRLANRRSPLLASSSGEYPMPDRRRGVDVPEPVPRIEPEGMLLDRASSEAQMSDSALSADRTSSRLDDLSDDVDSSDNLVDDVAFHEEHRHIGAANKSFTQRTRKLKLKIDELLRKRKQASATSGVAIPLHFHEFAKPKSETKAAMFWQVLTLATTLDILVEQKEAYGPIQIMQGIYSVSSSTEDAPFNYTQHFGGVSPASEPTQLDPTGIPVNR